MSHKCLIHKIVFLLPTVAILGALASFIPQIAGSDNLPQQNSGDPLALLLGDVRMLVSNEMIGKADQYFHGGVTEVDHCSHGDGHYHSGYGPGIEHEHEHDDIEEDNCDHDHESRQNVSEPYDPWAAIKRTIRLPNKDRHLDDDKYRELLPWFWAAIKLNPQNYRAYLNAAYILETTHNMPEKALEVLDAGLCTIPDCAEIEFAKGLLLFNNLKNKEEAEKSFRKAIEDLDGKTDEDSLILKVRVYEFIGKIAHDRGDTDTLRNCFEKANATLPNHSCTKYLQSLLK